MHYTYSFFFSSRRRHTRWPRDWSSDVCSSDLLDNYKCYLNSKPVTLSAKELQLLILLAKHPNQIWSSEQLYDRVWGFDSIGDIQTVKVHISNLRRKLEEDPANPKYIKTVRGFGYLFAYE